MQGGIHYICDLACKTSGCTSVGAMTTSTTAPTESAAERAYLSTKRQILNGDVTGGQLLSENEIATALGMSRTPVHEAFLRLAAENLLVLAPRRGATVVPMGPGESRDILEMREAIETATARRLIADGGPSPALVAQLQENLARQRELANRPESPPTWENVSAFVEADADFHAALVHASRNQAAIQFALQLRDRQYRLQAHLLHLGTPEMLGALADHEAMLAAVEDRDIDEFARLVHGHVRRHRSGLV